MTKNELKDIIKECLYENGIIESVSDEKIIATLEYCIALDEGTNIENMIETHKVLSNNKKLIKEARKAIKNGDKEVAKENIDKAIEDLKELRKYVVETKNTASEIINSLMYLFVPYFSLAIDIYYMIMGTSISNASSIAAGSQAAGNVISKVETSISKASVSAFTAGKLDKALKLVKANNIFASINSALGISQLVGTIVDIIEFIRTKRNDKSTKGLGIVSTDILRMIDSYIDMLKKLKANIK